VLVVLGASLLAHEQTPAVRPLAHAIWRLFCNVVPHLQAQHGVQAGDGREQVVLRPGLLAYLKARMEVSQWLV
jgi:hypothetical protein